jgi:O-antigen/teichoic acid export membrane protein
MRVTAAFCVAGVGFAGGNLILARALPPTEYALVALVVALLQIGAAVAPAGADGIVNRREVDASPGLLLRVLATSAVVGALMVVASWVVYGLDTWFLVALFLGTLAGGANTVAGAKYQSMQRFGFSLILTQAQNYILAVAGIVTIALGITHGALPGLFVALGYFGSATMGWLRLLRQRSPQASPSHFDWWEALAYVGISVAGLILVQLERLVVPRFLTLTDLATFGVLGALAGSPYRMLQMGVGYTMLPRLRAAGDPRIRLKLLKREGAVAALAVAGASVAVWFLAPWIVQVFLRGKYELPPSLIAAAIVTGVLKVASAFASSATVALGTTRQLAYLNFLAWVAVAAGVGAAAVGSTWGLAGVIYGVGAGWLIRTLAATALALPHLGDSPPASPGKHRLPEVSG